MPRMVSPRKRFAELIPELAKFGLVGLVGSVVDLGGAAYLHGAVGIGPMVSKGLSINAASVAGTGFGTIFRYFSYKKWVFLAGAPGAAMAAGEAVFFKVAAATET